MTCSPYTSTDHCAGCGQRSNEVHLSSPDQIPSDFSAPDHSPPRRKNPLFRQLPVSFEKLRQARQRAGLVVGHAGSGGNAS